jgi:hypothetical protein
MEKKIVLTKWFCNNTLRVCGFLQKEFSASTANSWICLNKVKKFTCIVI